ncbi:MAG: YifB family Mg chelatase-like AAA ATPase [Solirubrobacterales bacterium]
MLAIVRTFALLGVEARDVRVEVDVRSGLPAFSIVGLPDAAVRESRERVRAALGNSGFKFPQERITVSLAPANLPKAGAGFDLAIAAGVLLASGQLGGEAFGQLALAGELALDGSVRSIVGALPMALRARTAGVDAIGLPRANAAEAALAAALTGNGAGANAGPAVLGLEWLAELSSLGGEDSPAPTPVPDLGDAGPAGPDLSELRGQAGLRRALEVAAAGGHSLLMLGPPGVGKSMAARRLPSILPPLETSEAIEALSVASACGSVPRLAAARVRPFRAPHHTISSAGLVGGGSPPRPGELSRAHRGLLFLDELPEFSRDALEALRQPLEDGRIVVARARHTVSLPCRAMVVAAANPCPCGRPEGDAECECAPAAVRRYRSRISGPLADRIDMSVEVGQPTSAALAAGPGERSGVVRTRVLAARGRQAARLGAGRCNAEATVEEIRRDVTLDSGAQGILAQGRARLGLSGRGYDRVLRLARTIADLAGSERVGGEHVAEALTLRSRPHE